VKPTSAGIFKSKHFYRATCVLFLAGLIYVTYTGFGVGYEGSDKSLWRWTFVEVTVLGMVSGLTLLTSKKRQAEIEQSGLRRFASGVVLMLVGIVLLLNGRSWLSVQEILAPYSAGNIVIAIGAFALGYVLARDGYDSYDDAKQVERDMYLRRSTSKSLEGGPGAVTA